MRRLLLIALLCTAACKRETAEKPNTPNSKDAAAPASNDESAYDNSVQPVYPKLDGPVPPLVHELCLALHRTPKERKAACCKENVGIELSQTCEQALATALADGAIKLEPNVVEACTAAVNSSFAGCDWMGPNWQQLPSACRNLLTGTKPSGASCRSSLECVDPLRCLGVGPTDLGKCAASPGPGSLCGTGVDTLAAFVRQDDYELRRPACASGYCDRNRCQAAKAVGEACVASVQCGPGRRCADKKCVEGAIGELGAACTGADCAEGLRCVLGHCAPPQAIGAPCRLDAECKAACVKPDGAPTGSCQQSCDTAPVLRQLSRPMAAPK